MPLQAIRREKGGGGEGGGERGKKKKRRKENLDNAKNERDVRMSDARGW